MNGFLLLLPLFFIRFGLLRIVNRSALKRAAFFAPLEKKAKAAYLLYQISTVFIVIMPLFLKVKAELPFFLMALFVYLLGVGILLISTINFAAPLQNGLNINGLYKFSRNPMYMGYFICFFGCVLSTGSLLLLGAVLVFVVTSHWIIIAEEKWCVEQFGEDYTEYMKKVRRYI